MGEFGPWHLLIVAGVFVVLFGAKKLPDAARSLGRSARILKTELKDLHDDDHAAPQAAALQATPPAPVVPVAPEAPVVVTPVPVAVPESATHAAQPPAH